MTDLHKQIGRLSRDERWYVRKIAPLALVVKVLLVGIAIISGGLLVHAGAQAGVVVATAFASEGDARLTRFSAEVSGAVAFKTSLLSNPYRIVIDVEKMAFDLPKGAGRKGRGLVKKIRYGVDEQGQPRVVLDTTGPVVISKSYLLPAKGNKKSRIVVEMFATTEAAFSATQIKTAEVGPETVQVTGSLGTTPTVLPEILGKSAHAAGKKVIVLDPGHGGIDPGAVSPRKVKEKEVVLAFALELAQALRATGRFEVVLTRQDDRFVSLSERVKFTRECEADLFIAIHADTVKGKMARGTTIYTLSETGSDEEAEALALKENRADIIAGIDMGQQNSEVANVLIDLALRESKNNAVIFSRLAINEIRGQTTLTGKPMRSASFMVLKAPDVPSVLIELGYLSSKDDEKNMISPAWRQKLAGSLALAVNGHFYGTIAAATP